MPQSRTEKKSMFFVCLLSVSSVPAVTSGQVCETKLVPDDGAALDLFGTSVSISGDYAIVGASGDDDGSAYVFKRNGVNWIQEAKLTASDVSTSFGRSVSISGDYAVVGASGSAYVFKRHGIDWREEAKFTGTFYFGRAVSISGTELIVGDYVGRSAHIFARNQTGWSEQATLTPGGGSQLDWYGHSVAISDNRAIVGAPYDDDFGFWSGSVYVYERESGKWIEEAKIHASDADEEVGFGWSASISGEYAVVGGYTEPFSGPGKRSGYTCGSAYILHRFAGSWTEQAKFFVGDGCGEDHFGYAVSISDNIAIVGANGGGFGEGSAYLFERNGSNWTAKDTLTASDGSGPGSFAYSVSISGDYLIAGVPDDDPNGDFSGSAYVLTGFPNNLCSDITSMEARCIGGGVKQTIQVRVNLLNSTIHAGEEITIAIDDIQFTSTIVSNGIHSRASLSVPGWTVGDHIVSLVDPSGCVADVYPTCVASGGLARSDPGWDDAGLVGLTPEVPVATKLLGSYPNPFNGISNFSFGIANPEDVKLVVLDVLGREVASIVNERLGPGTYTRQWDSGSLPSGAYFYQLRAGDFVETRKLLLLK